MRIFYICVIGLIYLLGKSLDKIMELKALAGDQNLYDVLKQQKHKQKRVEQRAVEQRAADAYKRSAAEKGVSVFDFINKKIGHKKGNNVVHTEFCNCVLEGLHFEIL